MKLPWRRQKTNSGSKLPEEVKEYYQAGKRQRTGVAWLLAFTALVLTVAVVLGAFFGGRWVYRKIAGRSGPAKVTTSKSNNNQQTSKQAPPSENSQNQPSSQPSSQNSSSPSSSGSQPTAPTTQNQPQASPPTQNSGSGQSNQNLATTGPQGTLAAFIGATIVSAGLYQLRLRRKLRTD